MSGIIAYYLRLACDFTEVVMPSPGVGLVVVSRT